MRARFILPEPRSLGAYGEALHRTRDATTGENMLRKVALTVLLAAPLLGAAPTALAQVNINAMADEVEPRVIAWRRHIHQNPELSFEEVKTSAYIAEALRAMPGIEVQTGLAKTGIKAVLKGGKRGPVVALRADMDALPVEERNDLPFRSQAKAMWQGKETAVMHACGHDTHVAMLLGAAAILSKMRAELPGTVVFLFQPAEEWGGMGSPSGAVSMVAAGAMDNPKVEAVFGQHIGSRPPRRRNQLPARRDDGELGRLLHHHQGRRRAGEMPWLSKDPIVTAAQIVTNLQSIVSRQANLSEGAAVVTVGQFNAGNRINIIPEEATSSGTIRTLNELTRNQVHEAVTRMAQKVAEASGLSAGRKDRTRLPGAHQRPRADVVRCSLRLSAPPAPVTSARFHPLAADDFAAFSAPAPGFFWFLDATPHADRGCAQPLATVRRGREVHEDRGQGAGERGAGIHGDTSWQVNRCPARSMKETLVFDSRRSNIVCAAMCTRSPARSATRSRCSVATGTSPPAKLTHRCCDGSIPIAATSSRSFLTCGRAALSRRRYGRSDRVRTFLSSAWPAPPSSPAWPGATTLRSGTRAMPA